MSYQFPNYNSNMVATDLKEKYLTTFDELVADRESTRSQVAREILQSILDVKIKFKEIQEAENKLREDRRELKNSMEAFVAAICEE